MGGSEEGVNALKIVCLAAVLHKLKYDDDKKIEQQTYLFRKEVHISSCDTQNSNYCSIFLLYKQVVLLSLKKKRC